MAVRYCRECGGKHSLSAVACPHCGAAIRGTVPQVMHVPGPVVHSETGPVIAALASVFIPGLGQLCRGRLLAGILWFIFVPVGYFCLIIPGLILHAICIADAARRR